MSLFAGIFADPKQIERALKWEVAVKLAITVWPSASMLTCLAVNIEKVFCKSFRQGQLVIQFNANL